MKCTSEQLAAISQDSNYHDIGALPSNGAAYGDRMDKLYVRTLRMPELKLLSKAAQLKELGPMIRAVDNCISHDVADLTIGDFYYVLLWLRLYSMPKSPYTIEWHCDQPFFTHKESGMPLLYSEPVWPAAEKLAEEYHVVPCNTENTSIVHHTSVSVISLDDGYALPKGFDFPRVAILEELNAALQDAEMCMLVPGIQWMPGITWAEKMTYAEANPHRIGEGIDINGRVIHGIDEEVRFQCNRCRVEHTHKLQLNAMRFFQ